MAATEWREDSKAAMMGCLQGEAVGVELGAALGLPLGDAVGLDEGIPVGACLPTLQQVLDLTDVIPALLWTPDTRYRLLCTGR